MNSVHKQYKKHVSPLFQTILFIVVTSLLAGIIYKPIQRFTSYDQKPSFIAGIPAGSTPTIVHSGLHIDSFAKSDILKNDFVFEGNLWFEFDPKQVSLDDIKKFDIDHGQILEKSDPIVTKHGQHTLAQFIIRASFKTNLDYRAYPLDNHVIHIVIENPFISAEKVSFHPADIKNIDAANLLSSNSKLDKITIEGGYVTSKLQLSDTVIETKTPQMVIGISCNRIDLRHFLNIFMPLLLIFFLTLLSFSFDFYEQEQTIPTLVAAGVPALLAYRFVIESISPDVDYFMLSDYLFFLFLLLVFTIFIITAGAFHTSDFVKKCIIMGLYACMLISCSVLFYWIL